MNDLSSSAREDWLMIDPLAPDVVKCPYQYYSFLQEHAPVLKPEGRDFYLVSRHEDVMQVLTHPETFSADYRSIFNKAPEVTAILEQGAPSVSTLATLDPPDHNRFRSLVNRAFTPARVNALTQAIEDEASQLIDGFIEAGTFDVVSQFAVPFTMSITADQLGVPRTDLLKFKRWSDARVVQFSLMTTLQEECEAARRRLEFQAYFSALLNRKRANPINDMISVLATTKFDDLDRGLTIPEFLSIAEQLMTAGNLTTTHIFGSGMLMLLRDPKLMHTLKADPTKIRPFIDEALRLESPASGIWRLCMQETELGGTLIPKGSAVHIRLASANRDPREFECPEALNLERDNLGSHTAFGGGVHYCIGHALAKKELEIGFKHLLRRLDNMRLQDGDAEVDYIPSFTVRGVNALQIEFDKAPSAAN